MVRTSLRSYLPAVLRQWWTYAGIASGLVGYGLDLIADLKIPVGIWLGLFAACLVVAQFYAYDGLRLQLAARDRGLQLPQWAMWACNANTDGTWLTLLVVGNRPKRQFETAVYAQLIAAIDLHFGLSAESRKVEGYPEYLRITMPKNSGTPEFLVQLGVGQHGVLCIQYRTRADPLPLVWVLRCLDRMMTFSLSADGDRIVGPKNRDYTICLGEWPAGGISLDGMISAQRLSDNFVRGSRTVRHYQLHKHDRDGWRALREFAAAVLSEAGYVEFETDLATVNRERFHEPTIASTPSSGGRSIT